jgi:hypothetical protein
MLLHGDGTNGAQNNTFLDSSTNNYTITRYGNTTQGSFSPYGSNWSNYFDGSVDYLSVPDNAALEGFTNFTFECWVNVSDFSSGDCIFAKGWTPGGFTPYMFYFTSTDLVFYASSSLSNWDVASGEVIVSNIVKNQWYHVAASRSGSSIKLFVNGAVTTSFTSGSTLGTNAGALTIGASLSGDRDPTMYVSNLRINNTALYTAAFTPSTTPLTAVSGTALLTCQSNRFVDNSTNNFTVTPNGNVSVQRFNPFGTSTAYSTSVIGGSAYYDSSGDSLSTPASSANIPQSGDDYTVEAWIYITVVGGVTSIYSGNATGYFAYRSAGRFEFVSSSLELRLTFPVPLNQWCHAAVTRQSGTVRMFINGALTSPTVASGSATGNTDTLVGASTVYYFGSYTDSTSGPFGGYISNFRIVKGTAVYTAAFTPPTAPLTAVTNTAILLNNINGAIFDNAMMNNLETAGNAQISTSVKKYGTGSLALDGTGDYLVAPNSPNTDFGTGNFTVEGWFNWTVDASGGLVSKWGPGSAFAWLIDYVSSSNLLRFYTGNNGGVGTLFTFSFTPTTGQWYHIAFTRSGTSLRCFVDGTQVGSTGTTSENMTAIQNIYVGTNINNGTYLNGYIDDVRITKGYARYTTTFTPPTAAFPNIGPT